MLFNPDVPQHIKELEKWYVIETDYVYCEPIKFMILCLCYRYMSFIVKQNLKDSQCIVFAHHKPNAPDVPRQPLACEW